MSVIYMLKPTVSTNRMLSIVFILVTYSILTEMLLQSTLAM